MNQHETASALSQQLTALRTTKNVTQETVADTLGISNKTVSKWETGASLPDADYLPLLADYYGVSIDALFGRQGMDSTAEDHINREYAGLNCHESVLKAFELSLRVMRGCLGRFSEDFLNREYPPKYPLPQYPVPPHSILPEASRTVLSDDTVFETIFNNKDVNMAVMLFGSESDFGWMTEKSAELISFFEFLADADALKIVKLIHSQSFPASFTADFMAEKAGISISKTVELLEKAAALNLCSKLVTAHLREGVIDIYSAFGDGILLSVLTLAYEHCCGRNYSDAAYNGSVKMIRGGLKP
jgi:transcriptional regulator with XRE-family HTH domain